MKITLQNTDGLRVHYDTDRIACIEHDKAYHRYNKSDLAGNGIKANDSIIIITFKDRSESTFSSDWRIIF